MKPVVVATDLDRTLIYSMAAITATHPAGSIPPLVCVEIYDGQPLSYLTVAAAEVLRTLRTQAELVPITTRTPAQYQRVELPGGPARYAIVSNGGHILVDGAPDARWRQAVERRIAGEGSSLAEITAGLDRQAVGDCVLNRKVADNLFCYLVVDLATLPPAFLDDWTTWCMDRGWVVSMQGRKIYAIPRGLTKESALAEVVQRTGADHLLAAGDGALDAGFLLLADRAIRPPHGELAETGWRAANVEISSGIGVLAGEVIVRWLAGKVDLAGRNAAVTADETA